MAKTPYQSRIWKRRAKQTLQRDNYRCQIGRDGCLGTATEADHIVPWRDISLTEHPDWYSLDNLRASCKHCNISRASNQKHQRGWERSPTEITLYLDDTPPPSGALVLHLGRLTEALGDPAAASLAFERVLAEVRRGEVAVAQVAIYSTEPDARQRFPHHEVIPHAPSEETSRQEGNEDHTESGHSLVW